jgi:hypothetical protein
MHAMPAVSRRALHSSRSAPDTGELVTGVTFNVKKIEIWRLFACGLKRRTQRIEANFFLLNQTSRPTVGQAGPDGPGTFF